MVTEIVTSGTGSTPGSRDRREEDGVTDLGSDRGWGPGIQTSQEVPDWFLRHLEVGRRGRTESEGQVLPLAGAAT